MPLRDTLMTLRLRSTKRTVALSGLTLAAALACSTVSAQAQMSKTLRLVPYADLKVVDPTQFSTK